MFWCSTCLLCSVVNFTLSLNVSSYSAPNFGGEAGESDTAQSRNSTIQLPGRGSAFTPDHLAKEWGAHTL